jgi:putative transposase
MFVAENFIRSLVFKYGRHTVYTDGGIWYPQACRFLHLKHRLYPSLEKSLIERVMQYFKDRTECFDDYYPCINQKRYCDLEHVYDWIKLFTYFYNTIIKNKILVIEGEVKLTYVNSINKNYC